MAEIKPGSEVRCPKCGVVTLYELMDGGVIGTPGFVHKKVCMKNTEQNEANTKQGTTACCIGE